MYPPQATQSTRSLPDVSVTDKAHAGGGLTHVGMNAIDLPITLSEQIEHPSVNARVSATVNLPDPDIKGIHMSRLYQRLLPFGEGELLTPGALQRLLADMISSHETCSSTAAEVSFSFTLLMKKSALKTQDAYGWSHYPAEIRALMQNNKTTIQSRVSVGYSSTCPCSLELSEHARQYRGQLATPHSQRSVARISVLLEADQDVMWFEDLIDAARLAVPTETQVMVKREDEQAFAELNAANPIFVEDAARLFTEQLKIDPRVSDFRVVASHQESLHSHDAVSVMTEGGTFAVDSFDPRLFASLFHVG